MIQSNLLPKKIAIKLHLLNFYVKTYSTKAVTLSSCATLNASCVGRIYELALSEQNGSTVECLLGCTWTSPGPQMFCFLCSWLVFIWVTNTAETRILNVFSETSAWSKINSKKFKLKSQENPKLMLTLHEWNWISRRSHSQFLGAS